MMTNKKRIVALSAVALLVVAFAVPAAATQLKFNGDMNHRFMLGTNHYDWFSKGESKGTLDDGDVYGNFAEIKYRFWFEAASDDGAYKGVFATEIGGLTFGQQGTAGNRGMGYTGDQLALEFRWGYFDFQLPFVTEKSRVRIGLQPFKVNYFKWCETVGAVRLYGAAGSFDYELAWARGYEVQNKNKDADDFANDIDSLYGRLDFKPGEGMDLGVLALYEWNNISKVTTGGSYTVTPKGWLLKSFPKNVDIDLTTLGIDGSWKAGDFFAKWDLMYQTGGIDNAMYTDLDGVTHAMMDYDVSAYFLHGDLGMKMGKSTLTYTFWYASGDDDPNDDNFDAFLSTDVDMFDGIIMFEGGWGDDDYFTERPYMLDKGFIMNKLAFDYQATEKLKVGVAGLYMMTAEDIEYTAANGERCREDTLGFEFDAYFKYKLFKNVELAVNAGYLLADDAMDYFEEAKIQDGSSDEDIFRSDMRIRYNF
jgi:hypothetical protein